MAGATSPAPELASPDADGLVGEVKIWPSHTLPGPKWRYCNGDEVSRAEFSLLFSRIGEEHGNGDGSTTFNLPDYEGKFLVGYDAADADFDGIGDTGGAKSDSVAAHTHSTPNHSHGPGSYAVTNNNNYTAGGVGGVNSQTITGNSAHEGGGTTGSGGSDTITTVPPFCVTRFVIKVL